MTAPDEDYGRRERLLLHHPHQYPPPGPPPPPAAGERYIPAPTPPSGDRYIPPAAPALGERYLPSSDRYLATASPAERYLPSGDRFLPAPVERYLPPSVPAPGERYMPPPPSAAPGGPGDPYMRRDLGYHHHYRLPHPSYHPHHQYHPHYHHQRALPSAPHHRSPLNYHPHVVPSPSRGHIRCCPSPSHYGPAADPPYVLSPSAGSPANGSACNIPSTSGLASGAVSGVVMLAASATSSSSSSSSSASSAAAAPTASVSVGVGNTRDYMTSPSPLLPHRGRTPPCSAVSQRLAVQSPTIVTSSAPNVPVIEYVGASGGRHVSTPTPPPAAILPRCGSLNSCELGIENPLCGSAEGASALQQPPHRRGCSGVLETLDPQGSTVSLCCGTGRRLGTPQQQLNAAISSAGEVPPESRQSATSSTPSHPPLHHPVW